MTDLNQLFHQFSSMQVAVIGDAMLDTYWWGHVERISPEAPVPVVSIDRREQRIGGAGNVALNAAALGAKVSVITVLGNDDDAGQLTDLLEKNHISTKYIVKSSQRQTTNKIRIISRNQQMMRLDTEQVNDISEEVEDKLLYAFENYLAASKPDAVILEDYNKGVLTERVIEKIISLCNSQKVIVAVDPKKKNFFAYTHADIFKPNLKEVKEALNILSDKVDIEELKDIHAVLMKRLSHQVSFITLSEKGAFYQQGGEAAIIPSHVRNIADVSGAGDTVIAVAAMVYAASKDVKLMAAMANIAGGLVCEEVGTAAINKEKLLQESIRLISTK